MVHSPPFVFSQISNYAKPGFQSRHNRAYWENVPFMAFGNGAASYVDGRRFSRPRDLPGYFEWVNRLKEEGWWQATTHEGELAFAEEVGAGLTTVDPGETLDAAGGADAAAANEQVRDESLRNNNHNMEWGSLNIYLPAPSRRGHALK